ncbi:PEP-CTERM sorting domain-containing protein [Acaryochloris marina]|uniref:PEP-CTERM protein-sorting domain-containing protein n=1 Tax=Acaryochloris marina (strain MBIC 11017) TaxID=329726 RepID=A8ZM58_ACAM1|nr:PEP-CTERM sorting domain-containing protein [Acaryochloris marina]ABW31827.1 hypothetical protein AM1_B0101 [Acaryochloris marina MBIC11017]
MKNSKFLAIVACAYTSCNLILGFTPPVTAASLTYNFRQDGFDEGAYAEGFFIADDLNGDGQIAYFRGLQNSSEVSDFRVSFSGNRLTPPTTYGFGDLFGLVYDLDGGPLGDGVTGVIEGISASVPNRNAIDQGYSAGPGPLNTYYFGPRQQFCVDSPFSLCGIFDGSTSNEIVAVPEPSTFLGSIVTIGLGILAKRKRSHLVRQKKNPNALCRLHNGVFPGPGLLQR